MCLPSKSQNAAATGARSLFGLGTLVLLACLAGPLHAGAAGALGVGLLVGVGGAVSAIALCVAAPAVAVAWTSRRSLPLNEESPAFARPPAERAREDSHL